MLYAAKSSTARNHAQQRPAAAAAANPVFKYRKSFRPRPVLMAVTHFFLLSQAAWTVT
jgi:hypothetical protein